jgi:cell wall-active antibiotic response 4TMS protein YvqF
MRGFDGDRYAEQLKAEIKANCFFRHSVAPAVFMAILLIVAGVLLFLVNLGWLPVHNIWQYWPLLMIGSGIAKWLNSHSLYGRTWGILIIGVGMFYLALMLGLVHIRVTNGSWPLSLLFIVFGIAGLAKILDSAANPNRRASSDTSAQLFTTSSLDPDRLHETAVLGSLNRRFETGDLKGGTVTCLLGSIELDLRRAQITNLDRTVTLELAVIMGSIKLRIPETWRLGLLGTPILGSYEDRTIPQARTEQPIATLMMTGTCIMGSVEIEN